MPRSDERASTGVGSSRPRGSASPLLPWRPTPRICELRSWTSRGILWRTLRLPERFGVGPSLVAARVCNGVGSAQAWRRRPTIEPAPAIAAADRAGQSPRRSGRYQRRPHSAFYSANSPPTPGTWPPGPTRAHRRPTAARWRRRRPSTRALQPDYCRSPRADSCAGRAERFSSGDGGTSPSGVVDARSQPERVQLAKLVGASDSSAVALPGRRHPAIRARNPQARYGLANGWRPLVAGVRRGPRGITSCGGEGS